MDFSATANIAGRWEECTKPEQHGSKQHGTQEVPGTAFLKQDFSWSLF